MNEKYIQAIRDAIKQTHGCLSRYLETVRVRETVEGKPPWEGGVEVFDLAGHPTARQCYAWGYKGEDGHWQYVMMLKVPPVDSPRAAVRAFVTSR